MSQLLETLANWKPFTALVVGDFMLDELVYGNADRLSPEAPVPVLHVRRTERRAGGSGHLCLDIAAMRGRVVALGVVGTDLEGEHLKRSLAGAGVDVSGLVDDPSRPTTVKRSLIGLAQHRHPQKMFRVDYESREPIGESVIEAILREFDLELERCASDGVPCVVCLEDYNKGVCTRPLCEAVIDRCRAQDVPVLVDPAAITDYSKYSGATAITPNRTEASLASGQSVADDAEPEDFGPVATTLLDALDLEAVVLTLDRHGALLLERGSEPTVVPTVARQVYDVTGAGDMVLAALGAGRANGLPWPDAVRLANAAAGLEVEKIGAVPIPIERIHAEVLTRQAGARGKTRTREELRIEVAALKGEGRKVVFTNGCFDIFHAGHLSLLRRAASLGDVLVVGLNSDDSVTRLKGPTRPINDQSDRAEVLAGLECVSLVTVFDEDTAEATIEAVEPDIYVKGGEYDEANIPEAPLVQRCGGRIVLLPMVEGRSTTATVERIRNG